MFNADLSHLNSTQFNSVQLNAIEAKPDKHPYLTKMKNVWNYLWDNNVRTRLNKDEVIYIPKDKFINAFGLDTFQKGMENVSNNLIKAYYSKAVKEGNPEAERKLGARLLFEGDEKKGIELLQMAEGRGDIESMYILGKYYRGYEDLKRDPLLSEFYLKQVLANAKTDDKFVPKATYELGRLYIERPKEFGKDKSEGLALIQEAADSGDKDAIEYIQYTERYTQWTRRETPEVETSAEIVTKPAPKEAQAFSGDFVKDRLSEEDKLRERANQNDANAQFELGALLTSNFKDVDQVKFAEGKEWLEKAAASNNEVAKKLAANQLKFLE